MTQKNIFLCTLALALSSSLSGQALAGGTQIINGDLFPVIENTTNANNARLGPNPYCTPYEKKNLDVAHLNVESARYKRSKEKVVAHSSYSAQTGWAIVNATRIDDYIGGQAYGNINTYQIDENFLTEEEYEDIAEDKIKYVTDLNIANYIKFNLTKNIEEFTKSFSKLSSKYSGTHARVLHTGTAHSRGILNGKTSVYRGHVNLQLECPSVIAMDAEYVNDLLDLWIAEQLEKETSWTSWLDADNPSLTGDWEVVSNFTSSQRCEGDALDIQARIVNTNTIYNYTDIISGAQQFPDVVNTFSPTQGLGCVNRHQPTGVMCKDYEVRFLCLD